MCTAYDAPTSLQHLYSGVAVAQFSLCFHVGVQVANVRQDTGGVRWQGPGSCATATVNPSYAPVEPDTFSISYPCIKLHVIPPGYGCPGPLSPFLQPLTSVAGREREREPSARSPTQPYILSPRHEASNLRLLLCPKQQPETLNPKSQDFREAALSNVTPSSPVSRQRVAVDDLQLSGSLKTKHQKAKSYI